MRVILAIARLLIKEIFRKKDFFVVLILTGGILFYASQLKFYNVENVVRYLMEIGLALIFFFSVILTVSLAARQYPSEVHDRTLSVLMAKPVSRGQFILGKFLGVSLAGISCFFIFLLLFTAITLKQSDKFSFVIFVQTGYLFCLNLILLSAMAVGLSFYLTSSANIAICVILYFLMTIYGPSVKQVHYTLYYLLPHFEFFDLRQRLIHQWAPISAGLMGFLTVYTLVYTTFFLLTGWLRFRKHLL